MLSIDEAIAKYKEKANFYKQTTNIAYGLELEQLAEWLEELKVIKEMDLSIPQHFTKEQSDWIKEYCINRNKEFYNKAIDNFVHECDNHCGFYKGESKNITREDILKIAEQLKEQTND